MKEQETKQEKRPGRISCKILIALQALVGIALVIFGFYCEENIYGPGYIDGFFSITFMVPGLCTLAQIPFYLTYPKYETKAYLAPYSFLLNVAMANTLDCVVFGLNHFPTNWTMQVLRCIVISIIVGVVNGAVAFVYVLLKGKSGKVLVGPDTVLVDGVEVKKEDATENE